MGLAMRMDSRLLFCAAALSTAVTAHDHHGGESNIPEGETVSHEPLGTIMWTHILFQLTAYGVIFPTGMVLGISKSRWHVPTQILGVAFAVVGHFLGHAHTGREFRSNNVHASFAWILQLILGIQVVLGIYLQGNWEDSINKRIRTLVKPCHSILGKVMPILSWSQLLFGVITALGFCQGDFLGQCASHFVMGSAFIAYGVFLTIILVAGKVWLRRSGRSQEFYDSAVLTAWGCVNVFTEHHWGTSWTPDDWRHTAIGVVWLCAGLVGMWLSWDRDNHLKRNFIPGTVLFITGWGISASPQELIVSATTYSAFGFALMTAGMARIVELAFLLKDRHSTSSDGRSLTDFQFLPIFCLYVAGFLLMGATSEQMTLIEASSIDDISYILVLLSVASTVFLFANMLIYLYHSIASADIDNNDNTKDYLAEKGHARVESDVDLQELMSDDEDEVDESKRVLRVEGSRNSFDMSSPSPARENHKASA